MVIEVLLLELYSEHVGANDIPKEKRHSFSKSVSLPDTQRWCVMIPSYPTLLPIPCPTLQAQRDSRSHTVCRREHPLWVDEGATADMPPVGVIYTQAHLPGPPVLRCLLSPHNALSWLSWTWGQDRANLSTLACELRGSWRGTGRAQGRTHQGLHAPDCTGGAVSAAAASAFGHSEEQCRPSWR